MENTIYHKTAKAQQELATRTDLLSFKVRQLLIMIDGQRDVTALRQLAPATDVDAALARLRELGLIAGHAAIPSVDVKKPLTNLPDAARIARVHALVQDSSRTYLGDGWLARFDAAFAALDGTAALEQLLDDWQTALRRSGHRSIADRVLREIRTELA
ncbi:hypothetical protein [Jeongeupia naejangsanensis]|uniref:MarR family transcriptional regulator n=1 Tax=Jeongeupia naejangsanensis TaxID=613195 RepID=A0ABS2BLC7_9NEIS|nr:hypothetical protein [Jeongeupia naejangsanensis]MBM3115883.1 hypothetical protein [Jeongeupia naejangsanensis]